MNQSKSSPVSTTKRSGGAGFCIGKKPLTMSSSRVPGRRRENPRSRVKVPCGIIWPNGEFGISYHSKGEEVEAEPSDGYVANRYTKATVRHAVAQSMWSMWPGGGEAWPVPPWLVKSPKSAHRPETYGRKGITSYGQKVVRSGAYLLQQKYGKDRLSFLTLTVPSYGYEDEACIAGQWAYLTKTLLQALRRLLIAKRLPASVVLVTEVQPKRLEDRQPGCLHLHLVFVGRHASGPWAYTGPQYRGVWLNLISNVLGRTVPSAPCENVQRVEKDASQYLSKYMTKGVKSVTDLADIVGWGRVPRQWWAVTAPIRSAVKKYTMRGPLSSSLLNEVIEAWERAGRVPQTEGVKFCRGIEVLVTEFQSYVIGFFGQLDRETYQDIRELVGLL